MAQGKLVATVDQVLQATGGCDGIAECVKVGNLSPLQLLVDAARNGGNPGPGDAELLAVVQANGGVAGVMAEVHAVAPQWAGQRRVAILRALGAWLIARGVS